MPQKEPTVSETAGIEGALNELIKSFRNAPEANDAYSQGRIDGLNHAANRIQAAIDYHLH
jgi:hypothetical protein